MVKPGWTQIISFGLCGFVFVAGCSSVDYSREARRTIKTVSVRSNVPEHCTFSGDLPGIAIPTRGAIWYSTYVTAPVGMVYDIIDHSETQARKTAALKWRMKDSRVDVGSTVRSEFLWQVRQCGLFARVLDEGGDAEFRISVDYGLSDGMGVRGSWRLWMEVHGSLVDKRGNILWKRSAEVPTTDERLPEFLDPFRSPEKLQIAVVSAARIATAELAQHLRQ